MTLGFNFPIFALNIGQAGPQRAATV